MNISRRDFLKYCAGSAAALGLEFSTLGTLEKVLAAGGGLRRAIVPDLPTISTRHSTGRSFPLPPAVPGSDHDDSAVSDLADTQHKRLR